MRRLFTDSRLFFSLRDVQSRTKLWQKLINIRVVKVDGSTPSIGSYLLRWLLFPIDGPITSGLGLLVVLLNKNNQRLGDLAAGTMVIKEKTIVRYMSAWTNSII